MTKFEYCAVLTIGTLWTDQGDRVPTLFGPIDGVLDRRTGEPLTSPGRRGLWLISRRRNESALEAAARCITQQAWSDSFPILPERFSECEGVSTSQLTIDVCLLHGRLAWRQLYPNNCDGIYAMPLQQVEAYTAADLFDPIAMTVFRRLAEGAGGSLRLGLETLDDLLPSAT